MEKNPVWNDFKKWWVNKGRELDVSASFIYGEHPLISPAMSISNSSIAVIDIKSMHYIYTSPNFAEFLGWDEKDLSTGGVQFAFSRIHPADQIGVTVFSELINTYFRNLPDDQKGYYRTFWDYHLLNNEMKYFKLLQQDCALKFDSDGLIEELLLSVSKIDNLISNDTQHLRMTNGRENVFYKYDHKLKANIKLQLLSEREMEVVKLVAKSMSLKQIASQLNISFNTVKKHSANMMQKLQVNDSLEMVNLLRVWGFI